MLNCKIVLFSIWYFACFASFHAKSLINQTQRFWTFCDIIRIGYFWTSFHWNIYNLILIQLMIMYNTSCTLLYWLQLFPWQHLTGIPFLHSAIISVEQCPYHISLLLFTTPNSRLPYLVLKILAFNCLILNLWIYHIS